MDELRKIKNKYSSRRRRITYPEGVVTKCITISKKADDLLIMNDIQNVSMFVNDLIVYGLTENNFIKQDAISRFNALQKEMEMYGYAVNIKTIKKNGKAISGLGES